MNDSDSTNALGKALAFLERLEASRIWYRLEHVRDSLMVTFAIPGERLEVEFFEDGHLEFERFVSTGVKREEELLNLLLKQQEDADRIPDVDK